tara:strand:+ start:1413 stop:1874 length:462 start_codon:yes stop_codon:yes gene_type:complete
MDKEQEGSKRRTDDIFSKSLRAGNRTYFFDVKSTKSDDYYLTITESKRRFNNDNGKFFYEKHKLFLYPEDFQSFTEFLNETLKKIEDLSDGKEIIPRSEFDLEREKIKASEEVSKENDSKEETKEPSKDKETSGISNFSDVSFEDLGKDDTTS